MGSDVRWGLRLIVGLAASVLSAACYSSSTPLPDSTPPPTSTSMPTSASTDTDASAPFTTGGTLAVTYGCTGCHGPDLSGNLPQKNGVYSANLTPDTDTGIGSWTLTNLTSALRDGVDDQGQPLCPSMPTFPQLTDGDIVDLYTYLQGIPAVSKAQTSTDCDGNPQSGGGDDDDAGTTPDATAADSGLIDAAADSSTDASGDPDAANRCGHNVCSAGGTLAASCDRCTAAVCAQDPYCCDAAWNYVCVQEVAQYCLPGTTRCN